MKVIFLSSISLEQVEVLEEIFAVYTEKGWILPDWLVWLREQVQQGDCRVAPFSEH